MTSCGNNVSGLAWRLGALAGCLACGATCWAQPAGAPAQPGAPVQAVPPGLSGARPSAPAAAAPVKKTEAEVRPFNPAIEGGPTIKAAVGAAKASSRRVLVVWGTGGGPWGVKLWQMMKSPAMRALCEREYEVVWLDVGEEPSGSKNMELARSLGSTVGAAGANTAQPHVTVLDEDGRAVAQTSTAEFEDQMRKEQYSAIKVDDFLNVNKAEQPDADVVLSAALAKAAGGGVGGGKGVVLMTVFDRTNVWSARLERWIRDGAAPIVGDRLVLATIDLGRNPKAVELWQKYAGERPPGLPWFAFIDSDGKVISTSKPEGGQNIGFPTGDDEIGMFVDMLRRAVPGVTDAQAKSVRESLVAERNRAMSKP